MALPILDGNQTSTTLATTVSGGAHYPNHIIASPVTIGSIPSISGTVTASVYSGQYIKVTFTGGFSGTYYLERKSEYRYQSGAEGGFAYSGIYVDYNTDEARWEFVLIEEGLQATNNSGDFLPPKTGWTIIENLSSLEISYENPLARQVFGTVTIGSLPAISGTVTASVTNSVTIGSLPVQLSTTTIGGTSRLNVTLSSATTVGATAPSYGNLSGGSDGTNFRAILTDTSGRTVVTGSTSILGTSTVTFTAITGSTSIIGTPSVTFSAITGSVSLLGTPSVTMGAISGTVTANVSSTTVTVSALPSGALTTRFGSVTTANTSQLTAAVTNASRKYLLAQNISAGTVTIGIGFSPTTTQGIQLTAGAGITFDSFCPTGAVWWLGATTGATWTILEG